MMTSLARVVAARLPDNAIRSLVDAFFVRTRKHLALACADPRAAQERRLQTILGHNAHTTFGEEHGFSSMKTLDDYRARVPLSSWDAIAPTVERMVAGEKNLLVAEDPIFYGTTSGTTGRRKLIPVTSSFVDECRTTNKVLYASMLRAMPGIVRGKRLSMRSPKTEVLRPGVVAGSITVALGGGIDDGDGALDAVPVDVFAVEDFQARYFLALRFALQERITLASAVNPSTLWLFARTLAERGAELAAALDSGMLGVNESSLTGESHRRLQARARADASVARRIRQSSAAHGEARMRDVFPNLCGLVCWKGGSAPFFLEKLRHSYGDLPVMDYGYAASEGCFGAPLSTQGAGSVLLPHAHVIELIPVADLEAVRSGRKNSLLLDEVEVGQQYYVVVTNGGGLYRYEMNDVVEVIGKHDRCPIIVFRHKGGTMSSLTGEKLGESHVVSAAAALRADIDAFVVAPVLPDSGPPGYVLAIDCAAERLLDDERANLAADFDARLMQANEEYEAKRRSLRLAPLRVARLPSGAFSGLRAQRVQAGAPDAHVKIPHLSPDGRLLLELGLELTEPAVASLLPCRMGAA